MSVNGITATPNTTSYEYVSSGTATTPTAETKTATKPAQSGVVYEPSRQTATDPVKKTYTPDTNLVNKLKADAEERTASMRKLVEQMMTGQAGTYNKANDIWSFLRKGNFTVDPATKAQAQEDISENGYWGVKQTSDRIIDFAKALTGGNPAQLEKMRAAFEKGFKGAEKAWGGKLPEISQKTYQAVMDKFDELASGTTTSPTQ